MVGTSIKHYRILRLLGQGGMGEVYEAEDTKLGRRVALKLLPKHFASVGDRRERFEREARTVAALNHPSIVTIHSVEDVDGSPFLTMELVEGKTLADRIGVKGMPLDRILKIATPLADAVAAAHQQGVLHRDLKPANVMVTGEGRVKVLDFGLAKLKEEASAAEAGMMPTKELTGEGKVLGTVAYMSPEQAEARPIDQRSDLFSLGVVMYEMATGERPFKGDTSMSVISSILRDGPRSVTELRPDLPRELARIIRRALAKDPEQRYQTAKDLRNDLQELQSSLDSGELQQPAAAAPMSPARAYVPWAAAAAIVGLAAVGAWWFAGTNRPAAPAVASSRPFDQTGVSRLTSSGTASAAAAISRDGRYVAYVTVAPDSSLNIRQVATSAVVQLVAPAAVVYDGVAFSPDADFVYYSTYPANGNMASLYRVPVLGGVPQKLVDDIDSAVTFSPDGRQMAFIRTAPTELVSRLMVGASDGTQMRVLAQRSLAQRFLIGLRARPAWSPDGRFIAAPVQEAPDVTAIVLVDAASGAVSDLVARRWTLLSGIEWLADGSGLLVTAIDGTISPLFQIWRLDYPSGQLRAVTTGVANYVDVSVTRDSRALVSSAVDPQATLWMARAGRESESSEVTTSAGFRDGGDGITWTRDGQLVFTSTASGNTDLWALDPNTGVRRQLTSSPAPDEKPATSPDGRLIAFESARDGRRRIWLMDPSGGNQRPLSAGPGDLSPMWLPDGSGVVFQRDANRDSWIVTLDGRESNFVAPRESGVVPQDGVPPKFIVRALSREGLVAGYVMRVTAEAQGWVVAILSLDGKVPSRTLGVQRNNSFLPMTWSPDGRAIDAPDPRDNNVWRYPIDGTKPRRLTNFTGGRLRALAWSPDGQRLAVSRGTDRGDVILFTNVDRH